MAVLEPRRVAPGALARWARQSLALVGRAPLAWALASALFAGLGLAVEGSLLAQAVLGSWALVHFQVAAQRADRDQLRLAAVPQDMASSLLETLAHFRRCVAMTLSALAVLALACALAGGNLLELGIPGQAENPGSWGLVHRFEGYAGAVFMGAFALTHGPGFMGWSFLLGRWCEGSLPVTLRLWRLARQRNRRTSWSFYAWSLATLAVTLVLTPLAFLVAPLLGVWTFVAFRDVFLHEDGNQPRRCLAAAPTCSLAGVR